MAWDSDATSSTDDDLESKPTNNFAPKKPAIFSGGKTKIKGASKGIGTRKSTNAPRGTGRKGSTNKSNALKNA